MSVYYFAWVGPRTRNTEQGMAAQWGSWTHTDNNEASTGKKGDGGGDGKKRGQKGFLELRLKKVCDLARLHADRESLSGQGPQELMSQNQ